MTSDIICIHRGEDGVVCEMPVDGALHANPFADHIGVPGRKCPTCDGRTWVQVPCEVEHHQSRFGFRCAVVHKAACPTCADSPVRGYQAL